MANVTPIDRRVKQRKRPSDIQIKHPIALEGYLPYRVFALTTNLAFRGKLIIDDIAIGIRDWRILALIAATGPKTNRELARAIALDAGTVSRAVKHLLEHNLIRVRRSKIDKRKQLVALTQYGADIHDAIAPDRMRFANEVLGCLSDVEQDALFKALGKIDNYFTYSRAEHDEWE